MFHPSSLPPYERSHFFRRVALAPLCLLLVAGFQVFRVWTAQQTPWKGGGFGMFSTVDAESARFVRCFLITESGRVPLPVPQPLDKSVAELKAAPSKAGLTRLADRLAKQEWRWRDDRQRDEAVAIAAAGGAAITEASLRSVTEPSTVRDPMPGGEHVLEPIPLDEKDKRAVAFTAVQAECWRYRYERTTGLLRGEMVASATAARPERPNVAQRRAKP